MKKGAGLMTLDAAARQNDRAGMIYAVAAIALLSMMDASVKWAMQGGLSLPVIMAVRGWMITLVLLLWAAKDGRPLQALRTQQPRAHVVRLLAGAAAPFLFFIGLKTTPLADATVLFFSAPLMMAALSQPLLGERVGPRRWVAIGVGFAGVVIAMRPDPASFRWETLLIVAGALSYALSILLGRRMGSTENVLRLMFYYHAGVALISSAAAAFFPWSISWADIGFILLITVFGGIGHLALTRAFTLSSVAVIAPFEYTGLVWATLLGLLIWGDSPAASVWVGAALIVATGLYIIWRQHLRGGGGRIVHRRLLR